MRKNILYKGIAFVTPISSYKKFKLLIRNYVVRRLGCKMARRNYTLKRLARLVALTDNQSGVFVKIPMPK